MSNNIDRYDHTVIVPSGGANVASVYGLTREEMRAMRDIAQIQGLGSGVEPLSREGMRVLQAQLQNSPLRDGEFVDASVSVVMDHPDRDDCNRATLSVHMRVSRNRR